MKLVQTIFLVALACTSMAADWPTTKFKVDFRIPAGGSSAAVDGYPANREPGRQATLDQLPVWLDAVPPDSKERIAAHAVLALYFEQSLEDAAEALTGYGYEPPSLPLFEDETGVYFKVHVFDFAWSDNDRSGVLGVYHDGRDMCTDFGVSDSSFIGLNVSRFLPLTSSQETFLYIVLAHELVHAIQYNYPATVDALNGCSAQTQDAVTVTEGTADAVAQTLAARHWPEWYLKYNYEREVEIRKPDEHTGRGGISLTVDRYTGDDGLVSPGLLGFREYQNPFLDLSAFSGNTKKKRAPYETSSFWMNVIDRYGIRFIDFLYRQPLRYGDNPSLFEWLDDALKKYKPDTHGLYTVFPHFVTEFASIPGSRIPLDKFRGPTQTVLESSGTDPTGALRPYRDKREQWMEEIMGDCKLVELVGGQTETDSVEMALRRISAGCIEIRWQGFENTFELDIEVEHDSLPLLDQVAIGLAYQEANGKEIHCYDEAKKSYAEPLWTCLHEKPFQNTGNQPLVYAKIWRESGRFLSGEGRRIVTVSNVAREAEQTANISKKKPLTIRIGIAETRSNDGRSYDPASSSLKGGAAMNVQGVTPENLYGITTSPSPPGSLMIFGIPVKDSDKAYSVALMGKEPAVGYAGPFKGTVSASTGMPAVTSMACRRHRDGVVGRMTRYDRDHLWIDIDADLCEITMPPPPDLNYPKVDEVKATIKLPFGWRYDPGTTPGDIVTPGKRVYIDRYNKRLPMIIAGQWPPASTSASESGGAGSDAARGAAGSGGAGSNRSGPAGGSGVAGALEACACTCDELAASDVRAAGLRTRMDSGKRTAAADIMNLTRCASQCQREYMVCRMEEGETRKRARESEKAAELERLRESCACSCEELAANDRRAQDLRDRQAAGEAIPMQEIMDVSGCYGVCNDEYTSCRIKQR